MLGKLLKGLETAKLNRKPAQAVAAPDISRVLRASFPPQAQTDPFVEQAADNYEQEVAPDAVSLAEPAFEANPEVMEAQAEEALDALTEEFEGWMRNDLEKMRDAWRVAHKPHANADDYRTLYTCAHNIRGAASSYGYPAVSRLCGSLCDLLSGTRPGENSALINLHIEACRAAVGAGPQGEGSESVADAVCEALEKRVAMKVAAAS
ncbi:Hpt domain-containing protein [Hyphomonas sp.]|uniref:Hpt domain-containing protein n=1 Tax=Hyphomonas sp. TaxID=87 RepID=UPI001BCBE664|nr:Hpt domain-containing protein [Hyphomonas sp.]